VRSCALIFRIGGGIGVTLMFGGMRQSVQRWLGARMR
jgi:hypothetical protein